MTRRALYPILAVFAFSCAMDSAQAEDLAALYALAVTEDAYIAESRARFDSSHTVIAQGRSQLLPTLTLQGNSARNVRAEAVVFSYSDGFNSHGYSLNLSQNLLNFEAWYAYRSAKLSDQRALAELTAAEQDLIMRVAKAYFETLRSKSNLRSFEAEEEAAERIRAQSEQSFEVGIGTATDVLQARSNYDLARVRRLREENALAQRLEAIGQIVGQPVADVSDLALAFDVTEVAEGLKQWEQLSQEHSPAITAARLRVEASKADVKSANAARLPVLSMSAQYGYDAESANPYSFFNNTASIGTSVALNIRVPLYSGGLSTAKARQANYNRVAAQSVLQQVERSTSASIHNAFRAVKTDVATVSAMEQALASAQSTLDSTETGAQIGTRNIVDVVLAQRTLFQAQRDLNGARYDYILDTLDLKQAAGVLNPGAINELNAMLVAGY